MYNIEIVVNIILDGENNCAFVGVCQVGNGILLEEMSMSMWRLKTEGLSEHRIRYVDPHGSAKGV